jgi:hypothetical protein
VADLLGHFLAKGLNRYRLASPLLALFRAFVMPWQPDSAATVTATPIANLFLITNSVAVDETFVF